MDMTDCPTCGMPEPGHMRGCPNAPEYRVEPMTPAPNPYNRFKVVRTSDGQLISMWAKEGEAKREAKRLEGYDLEHPTVIMSHCPRCDGNVSVPSHVQLVGAGAAFEGHYRPLAECHRCGVGFGWHPDPKENLVSLNNRVVHGPTWFCDRPAPEFPTPTVTTDLGRDEMFRFPKGWGVQL